MKEKEPHYTEVEVSEKLKDNLSKIGFNVRYSDTNHGAKNPDFIAQKMINGVDYKIAIELKGNNNVNDAIKYGIRTLTDVSEQASFDKLLLLLLNRGIRHKQSNQLMDFLKDNPTNLEIINLDDLERWTQNLSNELTPKEQNAVLYYIKQLSKKLIELVAKNPDNLRDLEWRDLERTIAELFEGIGFKTTLTPSSKDGGKDVILECKIDNIKK